MASARCQIDQGNVPFAASTAQPRRGRALQSWRQGKFDELLLLPWTPRLNPPCNGHPLVEKTGDGLDWVRLTDDLSIWEREEIRLNGPNNT